MINNNDNNNDTTTTTTTITTTTNNNDNNNNNNNSNRAFQALPGAFEVLPLRQIDLAVLQVDLPQRQIDLQKVLQKNTNNTKNDNRGPAAAADRPGGAAGHRGARAPGPGLLPSSSYYLSCH